MRGRWETALFRAAEKGKWDVIYLLVRGYAADLVCREANFNSLGDLIRGKAAYREFFGRKDDCLRYYRDGYCGRSWRGLNYMSRACVISNFSQQHSLVEEYRGLRLHVRSISEIR